MADGLFRRLERDWEIEGASPAARAALTRWASSQPALRGLKSPLEVVQRCHDRRDAAEPRALLEADLAEANDDPLAVRTVVQALLPGLAGVARRARGLREGNVMVWESLQELDQHVVALAYERVEALAGRHNPGPHRPSSTGPGSACEPTPARSGAEPGVRQSLHRVSSVSSRRCRRPRSWPQCSPTPWDGGCWSRLTPRSCTPSEWEAGHRKPSRLPSATRQGRSGAGCAVPRTLSLPTAAVQAE